MLKIKYARTKEKPWILKNNQLSKQQCDVREML